VAGDAVAAHVAWDMVGHKNSITRLPSPDFLADSGYLTGDFVSEHYGSLGLSIPFENVATADAAGPHFHEEFSRTDARLFYLFDPDVPVVVIHSHSHGVNSSYLDSHSLLRNSR
jgi:hypothetical protein